MNLGFETETIEFKKGTGELKNGIISLASMLNKNGYGTVYFGVKDNGDVIGQQIGDSTLRDISQGIANAIEPQVIPTIVLKLLDGANVIEVSVKGKNTPYSAYGKYYIRSADEDRVMNPSLLRDYMQLTENIDFLVEERAPSQDLTFNTLNILYLGKGFSLDSKTYAHNLGLLCKDGKYNLLAWLLCDNNDLSVKVATFSGTDKSNLVKRNEYGFKSLIVAMEQVLNYIESINETKVTINGAKRDTISLFDFSCFREGWANACIHNNWSSMLAPSVYIFSDRIEILSYGGLRRDLTPQEFFQGISKPVNRRLQSIMEQLGYGEQTGHGVPKIVSVYGMMAFEITDNSLRVTIPFNKKVRNISYDYGSVRINGSQQKILNYLKENPFANIVEIEENLSMSDGNTRKVLQILKDKGLLVREGAKKNGYWKVIDNR